MLQVLSGRHLQLGEQCVGAGVRTGHSGTDPAQSRCEERVDGAQACQEGTHGNGLTGEVHDVCQCQNRSNGQDGPTHAVDNGTELGEDCRELEGVAALLVEEEVDDSNNQTGDDQQGAGVGHPREVVDSVLDGLAVSGDEAGAQSLDINLDDEALQPCLQASVQVSNTEDCNDDDVGQQCHPDANGGQSFLLFSLCGQTVAFTNACDAARLPELQEDNSNTHGDDASNNVGQVVCGGSSGDPLCNCEGDTDDQCGQPCVLQTLHTVKDDEQDERNEHCQERSLVTNDGCDNVCVLAADVTCGGNRDSNCAECHGCGVSEQNGNSSLEGLNAQGENHGCGNCNGSAEASQCLEQTAEAECDEDSLDAQVAAAEAVEDAAQVFKAAGENGELVEPDCTEDNPADDQAVDATADGAQTGEVSGHVEAQRCYEDGCCQCHECGPVSACLNAQ